MKAVSRLLIGLSGGLLLFTAYLHSTGLEPLTQALAGSVVPEFFARAARVQWLYFSWHLSVLAAVLLWGCIARPGWLVPAVVFCGVVTLGDFFWVFSVAGWFAGTVVLLIVVAALLAAAVLEVRAKGANASG